MLPEQKAIELLTNYSGTNNQILYWQYKYANTNKPLTKSQAEYILNYSGVEPKNVKRPIKIDPYLGQKYQEEKTLPSVPTEIYVEKLLAETEKAVHVVGKVHETEPMEFLWIPKCFIIKVNNKKVDIDYTKYSVRPPLNHQKEAIEKLIVNDKFILADDMGLGKSTSTVIAALESGVKKILIICPLSLKINWKREIEFYSQESIFILDGKIWQDGHKFYIINYDILKNFKEKIKEYKFDLIIVDEAHNLQNKSAQRTQIVNEISAGVKKLWLLTGTPLTSRPINYYNLLSLIDCPIAYNWRTYVKRYCKGFQFKVKGKKIWNVNGAANLEELCEKTKPYILRRLKSEVLDLPDKIISPVYLNLQSDEYETEVGEYLDWEEKEGKDVSISVQLSKLMKVRMIIAKEKIPYTVELIQKILDNDKKVIVFTNFTETLDIIASYFPKQTVKLDGRMNKTQRQHSVDQFQENPKIKLFVSNLKAGGVGITLTAAETVIMNDLSFIPSEHSQGEDRAYRYGVKNNVQVYYPIFENTIDLKMFKILSKKQNIIDKVMGDNVDYSESMAEGLLDELKSSRK